jgi:hypothetical protein
LLLIFSACEKNEIVPANLDQEMTPFEVTDNIALKMINEAVAYSSMGMLFDLRKGAEMAFKHVSRPLKASSCGDVYTTSVTQDSPGVYGFDSDFHFEILCGQYWAIKTKLSSSYVKPDYITSEMGFTGLVAYGEWTIKKIAENVDAYPLDGYYIRKGVLRYGPQTHERYNYYLRINIDDLNILALNHELGGAKTATFDLQVTYWSATGEEEKDFVEGTILFNTNGMFFVEIGDHSNVST